MGIQYKLKKTGQANRNGLVVISAKKNADSLSIIKSQYEVILDKESDDYCMETINFVYHYNNISLM